jgi:aminoglycoside 6'-N-acetyltransferase I
MTEHIEAFKEEHLDDCAHLFIAAFNAEPWNEAWTSETAKRLLTWTRRAPGFMGLVSFDDGVVAFATGYREPSDQGDVYYLRTLCVRPDAQRTGVGSRLMERLQREVAGMGANLIYLITDKAPPAQAFYEKNGYRRSYKHIVMNHKW